MAGAQEDSRESEWYVPKFGPRWFRAFVGLSFFPYTLMNASYVAFGSLLSPNTLHWDRLGAITLVYILSVGLAAHALDALAPNRPWGSAFSRRFLLLLAFASLAPSLAVGAYYAIEFSPLLMPIGLLEIFFLFAYNLELFGGRFHSDWWFALSWGMLPVLAGYASQTNLIAPLSLVAGLFGLTTAYVEISSSRPYKVLKKLGRTAPMETARLENILKGLVASHLVLVLVMVLYRTAS